MNEQIQYLTGHTIDFDKYDDTVVITEYNRYVDISNKFHEQDIIQGIRPALKAYSNYLGKFAILLPSGNMYGVYKWQAPFAFQMLCRNTERGIRVLRIPKNKRRIMQSFAIHDERLFELLITS